MSSIPSFFFLRINSLHGYELGLCIFLTSKKASYQIHVLVNNFNIVLKFSYWIEIRQTDVFYLYIRTAYAG